MRCLLVEVLPIRLDQAGFEEDVLSGDRPVAVSATRMTKSVPAKLKEGGKNESIRFEQT